MVNEKDIVALLRSNPRAVERAMVVIYDRQTTDEKAVSTTRHSNNRGFQACDARRGSYYARWVLSGKHLTGNHLERARTMAIKYRRQLVDAAKAKEAKAPQKTISKEEINHQEDRREAYKAALADHNVLPSDPPIGTWAATARIMAELDPTYDWDSWKEEMKEMEMNG